MKKCHAIVGLILFFSVMMIFAFSTEVEAANKINKIAMDVYINSNGDAEITEVWDTKLEQGTEGYKPYSNLGSSSITNFTVSDDSGKTYKTLSSWNTSSSFSNKAYKCGIHKVSNGVELCWGISNYGDRTYTLKYIITNFVEQYKDSQGVYFSLMPKEMEQSPKSVVITIRSDTQFTENNSKIWAFGYAGGKINFKNGTIVMDSNGSLGSSSYMTALIKIENGTFNTTNTVSKTFNDVYEEAMSDVDENEKQSSSDSKSSIVLTLLFLPLQLLFNPIVIFIIIFIVLKRKGIMNYGASNKLDFGTEGKKLPNKDSVEYFRDIPCNKDLYRAYWVIYQYDIESKDNCKNGLIGAIFLDWIKEGYVSISKTKKGLFSFKDNNYAIDLTNIKIGRNEVETSLLEMLKEASGDNEILEAKEFEKWCTKKYNTFENWFNNVIKYETKQLENSGMITETQEEVKGFFGKTNTITKKHVDSSMKKEAIELLGLRRFLLEYSMIPEREAIEVNLWEEYLIFAQLLGIADKVEEQFSKIYPDFNKISKLNTEYTTIYTRNMVHIGVDAARRARDRANASSGYSSGRGGSSHSSGGGSSRGSSSGGGFR